MLLMRLDELEAEIKTPRSAILDGMPKGPRSDHDKIGTAVGRLEVLRERAETIAEEVRSEYKALSKVIDSIDPGLSPANNALCRSVLTMRLLEMRTGQEVNAAIFMDQEDFTDREESYLRRIFKLQQAGLNALWKIMREEENN